MKLFTAVLVLSIAVVAPTLLAQSSHRTSSYSIQTPARKYSFAIVDGKGSVSCWGSWDSTQFKDMNSRSKQEAIYVRKDNVTYIITDKATMSAARKAIEPMEKLGKQQGELGRQQGELGKQQGELGRQQGELGRQMGEIARNEHSESEMQAISRKMGALGKQQGALGEKQGELGKKQGELGRQQGQAAVEAEGKITKLLDDAFARGLAKPA